MTTQRAQSTRHAYKGERAPSRSVGSVGSSTSELPVSGMVSVWVQLKAGRGGRGRIRTTYLLAVVFRWCDLGGAQSSRHPRAYLALPRQLRA